INWHKWYKEMHEFFCTFCRDLKDNEQSKYLFHNHKTGEPLSKHTPRHIVKAWITRIGGNSTKFASHSARRGGATAIAASGVDFRLLKRHGGWRSDTAPAMYIDDSAEDRLNTAKAVWSTAKPTASITQDNRPRSKR